MRVTLTLSALIVFFITLGTPETLAQQWALPQPLSHGLQTANCVIAPDPDPGSTLAVINKVAIGVNETHIYVAPLGSAAFPTAANNLFKSVQEAFQQNLPILEMCFNGDQLDSITIGKIDVQTIDPVDPN